MKQKQGRPLKQILFAVLFIAGIRMIPLPAINGSALPVSMLGSQPAEAAARYGILGQNAPEIMLDTWIDGNGKKIEPIRLNDFRGKVVYLYFFQDW